MKQLINNLVAWRLAYAPSRQRRQPQSGSSRNHMGKMPMPRSALCAVALFGLVVGCEQDMHESSRHTLTVPDSAQMVAEGAGELSYLAKDDGRIWIFDADTQKVIAAKRVREGQKFTLKPDSNSAMLDSQKVISTELKRKDQHRLYFEKE